MRKKKEMYILKIKYSPLLYNNDIITMLQSNTKLYCNNYQRKYSQMNSMS